MTKDSEELRYQVTWSEVDEAFVGHCLQFPSIGWLSETSESALAGIRAVVKDIVRELELE